MLRLLTALLTLLSFALTNCEPPVRVRAVDKKNTRDSAHYVGIAEAKADVDLRKALLLGTVKVGDRGATLDCRYPDVLELACRHAGRLGGNLLVIVRHRRNEVKSNCHVILAEVYSVSKLDGMESRMYWHPERRLTPADLRAAHTPTTDTLPPLHTLITCRLGGDFFREAFIRTETLFWPDSASLPEAPSLRATLLRRAQLHFDLAEVHARQLKATLLAIGPDLEQLVNQHRVRTEEQVRQLRAEQEALDAALRRAPDQSESTLTQWESNVRQRLETLGAYAGHQRIDLRKRKG